MLAGWWESTETDEADGQATNGGERAEEWGRAGNLDKRATTTKDEACRSGPRPGNITVVLLPHWI